MAFSFEHDYGLLGFHTRTEYLNKLSNCHFSKSTLLDILGNITSLHLRHFRQDST
jgi:hypothetical protein